jgi:hypothetical protein
VAAPTRHLLAGRLQVRGAEEAVGEQLGGLDGAAGGGQVAEAPGQATRRTHDRRQQAVAHRRSFRSLLTRRVGLELRP